jgi:hypothetical protein
MWPASKLLGGVPLLAVAALTLLGCPDDSELDKAIREYVELRVERGATECKCYQLFLNMDEPGNPAFTSEQECLATQPSGVEGSFGCIKSVLESSAYDTKGSTDVMRCYNAVIEEHIRCMEQYVAACEEPEFTDCGTATLGPDSLCQGKLSDDEVSTIVNCASP